MAADLPLTGERTVPGLPEEAYWFARHEVVYRWIAAELADTTAQEPESGSKAGAGSGAEDMTGSSGRTDARRGGRHGGPFVVDAGCGEGYGADLLAATGARVLALEYDDMVCRHAASAYDTFAVVRANLVGLPLRTACADVVVSLQVIEHLWDLRGFLAECRRVLRPSGRIVVSTPNRPVFSPGLARGARPVNPFHVEEFDARQVQALLVEAGFDEVRVHGLEHGARLRAWEAEHGSLVAAQVAAALAGRVDAALAAFVSGVTDADFDIRVSHCDIDGVTGETHDLIGVGVVPW